MMKLKRFQASIIAAALAFAAKSRNGFLSDPLSALLYGHQ